MNGVFSALTQIEPACAQSGLDAEALVELHKDVTIKQGDVEVWWLEM